jgi:amino acid transporter
VLSDLASSAYYVGGDAEKVIGKSAPWFVLAVMLFSYAVRSIYIESSSMFVRGGVYRVVKEAMGSQLAKLSVSALLFDYVLTGPISAVSAGQYLAGFVADLSVRYHHPIHMTDAREGLRGCLRSSGHLPSSGGKTFRASTSPAARHSVSCRSRQ